MNQEMLSALAKTNFTALDWGLVAAYLAGSVLIGFAVKKYVGNMADYVTAGRSVGTALGVATMTGTELGLITVMYSAQKGFVGGFAAFHIALLAGIVTFFVGVSGFLVVRLRELKVLTIPEFYERRFGRRTRILGGIMLTLGGVLNMGLFLKVGSMFIVGITGMSEHGWALPLVMTTLLGLVLLYTVLGGMISVIITDYVQYVVLAIGLILACLMAVDKLGWSHIFQTITAQMGAKGYNPFVAEGAFGWDYVVWMAFLGLVSCAIWPTAVARALAMDSTQSVKRLYKWSSVSFTIRFMIPYFLGICAFVFIKTAAPDLNALFFPAEGAGIKPVDNLYALPIFLGRILPVGVIGVITAAMIAAFMSTHDSYLLCWSSVITQDIIAPLFGDRLGTKARILLTRIVILLIGLYILWWGLFYNGKQDIWDYMAVTGAIYFTGAFAVLLGGLYWKKASSTGAILAMISGCSAIIGLEPVQKSLGVSISGARVGLATILFSLFVMMLASVFVPDDPKVRHKTVRGVLVLAVALLIALFVVFPWEARWTLMLNLGLILFAGMSVWVIIWGYRDIFRMFRRLDRTNESEAVEED